MSTDVRDCVCMNLRRTARQVAQFYDEQMRGSGLRSTQFTLLTMIDTAGPISITHLAEYMGMDRTTLTRNLKLMDRDGFTQIHAGDDARTKLVSISRKGGLSLVRALPYWQTAQTNFVKAFGARRWQATRKDLADIESLTSQAC